MRKNIFIGNEETEDTAFSNYATCSVQGLIHGTVFMRQGVSLVQMCFLHCSSRLHTFHTHLRRSLETCSFSPTAQVTISPQSRLGDRRWSICHWQKHFSVQQIILSKSQTFVTFDSFFLIGKFLREPKPLPQKFSPKYVVGRKRKMETFMNLL